MRSLMPVPMSIARLPQRFPLTSRYYKLLFAGELGYQVQKAFTSYPTFLGIALVDDTFTRAHLPVPRPLQGSKPAPLTFNLGYADETVVDYDHPKLLLFKNKQHFTEEELYTKLTQGVKQVQR